jgi:ribonuclease D
VSAHEESARLSALAEEARAAGTVALDTEFVGEGRYRTLLCLVQLAIPEGAQSGERILMLDPLAEDLDGAPLASLLEDPAVQVVVHAGRQDIALVRRRFRCEARNVFDTQVAAGFAGLGAQSSYESLLGALLGLRVAKSASFTRWETRPLSREQLAYAREDVVHLLALASELERRLRELGRLEWAREECEALERASDERDLDLIFERLPRVASLSGASRAVARELLHWREQTAERQDRPVQSVLGDATLVELARRRPSSREQLTKVRGAGALAQGRRAEQLLTAIRAGEARPPEAPALHPRVAPPRPADAPLIALAESLVRARAREAGIAYELLAARAELQGLLTALREGDREPDARVFRGWRRQLAGAELLELLAGRVSLSVRNSGRDMRVEITHSGPARTGPAPAA